MKDDRHEWWQTGVIYQIYPRSFQDTTGNGVGDLRGITRNLDYLSETLGVDALWISPFYPSPMKDFGYDISNYRDVDPLFGDLSDFDELLSQAHRRDLKILIDLVPNHTSDQHPWFQESRSSRENPKRDWYVWADPAQDGGPPNNWLSVFGGEAWTWDPGTDQYYLHSFLKEQPDLNWRNPAVEQAVFDVARFWLERGVDGFRVDVAHYIMKDPQMRDNPPNPSRAKSIHRPLGEYDSLRHIHDKGHPDVHDVYRRFRNLLEEYSVERPRVAIGEIHILDWKEWASYYGEQLDELHMPFNFSLLGVPWEAEKVRQLVEAHEDSLPEGAWPNYVLGNHDEARLASRIGPDQARLAAMLLLTLRGTPTIYYGEEIGMQNGKIPPHRQLDPAGLRQPGQGRDMCRTPMQWHDQQPHGGFSPPSTEELWLPIGEYQKINVASQLDDPTSLLALYRSLLAIRKRSPCLQVGSYHPLPDPPQGCFLYRRIYAGEQTLVALNFSGEERQVKRPHPAFTQVLLSTHMDRKGKLTSGLTLRPAEGLILKR